MHFTDPVHTHTCTPNNNNNKMHTQKLSFQLSKHFKISFLSLLVFCVQRGLEKSISLLLPSATL